ncbi:MAG TPA: hypothetical protein VFT17_04990 [Propionibacteriaceae bacterium]|jgi:hypothetical protein|nr:hypothetical protein [Propionibacteriaceae bacterium]
MSLFATERVPQPVVITGVVDRDIANPNTVGAAVGACERLRAVAVENSASSVGGGGAVGVA